MTYGSRGLVGGHCRVVGGMFRGQSARWRRTVRRTLRKFTRAEGNRIWLTVRTADGPRTLRGQSGQLGFWEADGPPMYCGQSAVLISAGPGQLGQTNWWRRSIAWPRLLVSLRIVLKPYILHCAMTCKD